MKNDKLELKDTHCSYCHQETLIHIPMEGESDYSSIRESRKQFIKAEKPSHTKRFYY